jgi:YcxB-like protein
VQPIEYTLQAEDIASARLLALGVRPRVEFSLFAAALVGLSAISVTNLSFGTLPLIIGLTACLGAFRLMQINRVRQAAAAAFKRNETLRSLTIAMWDDGGVSIQPATALAERIPWSELVAFKESERIVLFQQKSGAIHAIPKRAFVDKAILAGLRRTARAMIKR